MKNRILRGHMAALALLAGLAAPAWPADGPPMVVLREKTDQVLAVLDAHLAQSGRAQALQEARIRQLALSLFDFAAFARLVLGGRWHDFTSEEQAAFEVALTQFLLKTYVPLVLDRYRGERIEYIRQVRLSAAKARVELRVWRDGKAIPVTVKMIQRQGQWRVYDLDALGFSAVGNYRAQFQWLLRQESPEQLIERLENMPALAVP